MVNIDLHKNILIKILREIYSDPDLRTVLGFKGGTAAMLFYGLPRFSVDLDFDLLDPDKKDIVFDKIRNLLPSYGVVKESVEKKYTLFFLLQYEKGGRSLKIEISKRSPEQNKFIPKNYLGISILVIKEEEMAAGKLSALLTRNKFAARDVYDLWYFLKNNWYISEKSFKQNTGLSLNEGLKKAQEIISDIKKPQLLSGLGDLLDNQQKNWAREKLIEDTLFLLKLYENNLK